MRSIIGIAALLFLVIFGAYLIVELIPSDQLGGIDRVRIVSGHIESLARETWTFARPILQLILILIILEWVLTRAGIQVDLSKLKLTWDIRALLAIIVVIAFSLGALAGSPMAGLLENVCLVVLGFYFGGMTKHTPEEKTPIEKE